MSTTPSFGAVIEYPSPLYDTAAFRRVHLKATRLAIEEALLGYWRGGFKQNKFKQSARSKYNHLPRSERYKSMKKSQTRSVTDHVRSGRTKAQMTSIRPKYSVARGKVGGVARSKAGVGITGRLSLKFPFPAGAGGGPQFRKDGKKKITAADMARELERWSNEDMMKAARKFHERYVYHLTKLISESPKLKKRYGAGVAGLK